MNIEVFTDGSATIATRPGGWGFVIVKDGVKVQEGSGHMEKASNNDSELEGAIQGLAFVLEKIGNTNPPSTVTLVSDSQLILGWANGTYRFKQKDKTDKFRQLKFLVSRLNVKTRWVEGHSGNEHNERCDYLANKARLSLCTEEAKKKAKKENTSFIGEKKSGIVCIWYKGVLKVADLDNNVMEDYNRDSHGPRGSMLEIREEKFR